MSLGGASSPLSPKSEKTTLAPSVGVSTRNFCGKDGRPLHGREKQKGKPKDKRARLGFSLYIYIKLWPPVDWSAFGSPLSRSLKLRAKVAGTRLKRGRRLKTSRTVFRSFPSPSDPFLVFPFLPLSRLNGCPLDLSDPRPTRIPRATAPRPRATPCGARRKLVEAPDISCTSARPCSSLSSSPKSGSSLVRGWRPRSARFRKRVHWVDVGGVDVGGVEVEVWRWRCGGGGVEVEVWRYGFGGVEGLCET